MESFSILAMLFSLVMLSIGSTAVRGLSNYSAESHFCGHDGKTYNSSVEIPSIMHCGSCGSCSNQNDISIYNQTRNTLTKTSTDCAFQAVLFGRKAATNCMEKVGFTKDCLECWIDNIICDKQNCLATCLKYKVLGIGQPVGNLDACLACDEFKCGDAFKKCAGANRRRAGIISDIDRNPDEVCKVAVPFES